MFGHNSLEHIANEHIAKMEVDEANPLLHPQREKSGPNTIRKYIYQYYWALCRVLDNHKNEEEYAVFVELHEDVVIGNSLNGKNALFEFNQVKTTDKKFTYKALIYQKTDSSILGKLISSCDGKPYSKSIVKVGLVTPHGFDLKLKTDDKIDILSFPFEHIDEPDSKEIKDAIAKEIALVDGFPKNLHFVTTDLPEKGFRPVLTDKMKELIEHKYPNSEYSLGGICRALMDELQMKGEVTEEFLQWDELLHKKALTSTTVEQVINGLTTPKGGNRIDIYFEEIVQELGYSKFLKKQKFRQAFDRYKHERFFSKTIFQLDLTQSIVQAIKATDEPPDDDLRGFIDSIVSSLPSETTDVFLTKDELDAAVALEFILASQ